MSLQGIEMGAPNGGGEWETKCGLIIITLVHPSGCLNTYLLPLSAIQAVGSNVATVTDLAKDSG